MALTPENQIAFDKLQAQEEAIAKQEIEASVAASKLFDPDEIFDKAKTIYTITDEKLGVIRYGKLSKKEFVLILKIPDLNDRVFKNTFIMLHKGYPNLTEAQFDEWPSETIERITDILAAEKHSFLRRTPALLKTGLKTTP